MRSGHAALPAVVLAWRGPSATVSTVVLMAPARRSDWRPGRTETSNFLAGGWSPPSSCHGSVRSSRIVDLRRLGDLDERRRVDPTDDGPGADPQPVGAALGGQHADVEQAVVAPGVGEDLDAAEDPAHVADEHARGPALEPLVAVDPDR